MKQGGAYMFRRKRGLNPKRSSQKVASRQSRPRSSLVLLHRICDSLPIKIVGTLSALVTVILGFGSAIHWQTRDNIREISTPAPKAWSFNQTGGTNQSVTQVTHGAQSPNVRSVGNSVKISYDSEPIGNSEESTKNAAMAPLDGSTRQISHGAQSPNISRVAGGVEIRYRSQTKHNSESSAEK